MNKHTTVKQVQHVTRKKQVNKKKIHLDIGCGPGTFIGQLNNSKCYGVDVAKKQIQYAKKNYKTKKKKIIMMKKNKIQLK